jgi:hypothetical protein
MDARFALGLAVFSRAFVRGELQREFVVADVYARGVGAKFAVSGGVLKVDRVGVSVDGGEPERKQQ